MAKVFINPGHDPVSAKGGSGYDCGAWNPRLSLYENEVALEIANLVSKYLQEAGCGTRVFQSESLSGIVAASDEYDADVFVSIHCNAFNCQASGAETYSYYNSKAGGRLAACVQKQIVESLPVVDRGVKTAGFHVIRYTAAPAILVETAFIDNDSDAMLLRDRADDFARAIARGITDFLTKY